MTTWQKYPIIMENSGRLKVSLRNQIYTIYHPNDAYRALKAEPFINIAISYGILLLINSVLTELLSLVVQGEIELIHIPLFLGTVGLLISAAILHLLVFLLGGRQGFKKTLAVAMYGVTPLLLTGWIFGILGDATMILILGIPLIVYLLLFFAWSIVLMVLGLREVQELTPKRSTLATGTAVAVLLVILVISSLFIISLIAKEPINPSPVIFMFGTDTIVTSQRVGAEGAEISIENTGTPIDGIAVEILPDTFHGEHEVFVGYNTGTVVPNRGVYAGYAIFLKIDNLSGNGTPVTCEQPLTLRIPFDETDNVPVPYYIDQKGRLHLAQTTKIERLRGEFEFITWRPEGHYLYFLDTL